MFPYKIRRSNRIKGIQLKVCPKKGLEIVVPARYTRPINAEKLLDEHREWILKHLPLIQVNTEKNQQLPKHIALPAIDEDWQLVLQPLKRLRLRLKENPQTKQLTLVGPVDKTDLANQLLRNWLKKKAKHVLQVWLDYLSHRHQLPYNRLSIRGQQSMWGSCSSDKAISLNYKLLLVPRECCRYILIHELCHTRHMDHSRAYWQLVASCDALYKHHKKLLGDLEPSLPGWL